MLRLQPMSGFLSTLCITYLFVLSLPALSMCTYWKKLDFILPPNVQFQAIIFVVKSKACLILSLNVWSMVCGALVPNALLKKQYQHRLMLTCGLWVDTTQIAAISPCCRKEHGKATKYLVSVFLVTVSARFGSARLGSAHVLSRPALVAVHATSRLCSYKNKYEEVVPFR